MGRFDQRKGIETLVRACAQLKGKIENQESEDLHPYANLKLVIVGGSEPDIILSYRSVKLWVRVL